MITPSSVIGFYRSPLSLSEFSTGYIQRIFNSGVFPFFQKYFERIHSSTRPPPVSSYRWEIWTAIGSALVLAVVCVYKQFFGKDVKERQPDKKEACEDIEYISSTKSSSPSPTNQRTGATLSPLRGSTVTRPIQSTPPPTITPYRTPTPPAPIEAQETEEKDIIDEHIPSPPPVTPESTISYPNYPSNDDSKERSPYRNQPLTPYSGGSVEFQIID